MFKNTFQSGFLSILYSIGSKPLQIWDKQVRNGHIKRITDQDIQSSVLEIMSTNISTTFVSCPADANKTLGIKLPFLVMIIKNVRAPPAQFRTRAPHTAPRRRAHTAGRQMPGNCLNSYSSLHVAAAARRAGRGGALCGRSSSRLPTIPSHNC